VRTFVDLGPPMQTLLAELARRSVTPHPYVTRLLAAFPPPSEPPEQASPAHAGPGVDPIDALTSRETEILHLLAARLSQREIAASLGISTETVKRHTHTIYQKLMIGTRRAAVDRAQLLGLVTLPRPGSMPARSDLPGETEERLPRALPRRDA
jgi:LuxR family maltose regulon positive regulatory protein